MRAVVYERYGPPEVLELRELPRPEPKARELAELARNGALSPVIDRVYALEQLAEAHAYVESKRKRGSVIVTLGHGEEIHGT